MATPNSSAARSVAESKFEVGTKLRLTTCLNEELEGQVLAFDAVSNFLVIQDIDGRGSKRNVRFLHVDHLKEVAVREPAESATQQSLLNFVPHVDVQALRAKEEAALRKAEADAERIGVGVTADAQDIFFALSKTLPVRWSGTTIVVLDEVRVTSPYTPESVVGGTSGANERVRKVLAKERERLGLLASSS